MTAVFVPLFRMAANYDVSFGRRWSVLEQMLLVELATKRHSVTGLAADAKLPERLIVEALINLLRAGWIEVRSTAEGNFFAATTLGKRRAAEEDLPAELQRGTKWISLCVDRLTGAWLRADDLELVYDRDLPPDSHLLEPSVQTYDQSDPAVRELVYLNPDETLESFDPQLSTPSRPFARVTESFGQLSGLPDYAPLRLRERVRDALSKVSGTPTIRRSAVPSAGVAGARDTLTSGSFIVGGAAHRALVKEVFQQAKSYVAIHSCFVHPDVVSSILQEAAAAAKRGVRTDLLWGLRNDPEEAKPAAPISASQNLLAQLDQNLRTKIHMSTVSSGSHAKAIVYDDKDTGRWVTVVGSCNFLSSWYDALDCSIKTSSTAIAKSVLANLLSAQLPSSGAWPGTARRLDIAWNSAHKLSTVTPETGSHMLEMIIDQDHYACLTTARDEASKGIVVACDLFGLAAKTSVLVPMQTAVEDGCPVQLYYQRTSKGMVAEGRRPESSVPSGVSLTKVSRLHAKVLLWDDDSAVVSSFNWLSTVVAGARARGAEIGIRVRGADAAKLLLDKFTEQLDASTGNDA